MSLVLTQRLRWNLDEIREGCARSGLPLPDEAVVRERCLGQGVDAPDLPTVKDFIRFHAAASRGKIVELPTIDSVIAFAEWFFAGFTRVTGTPTIDEDRNTWSRKSLWLTYTDRNIILPGAISTVSLSRSGDLHPRALSTAVYLDHPNILLDWGQTERIFHWRVPLWGELSGTASLQVYAYVERTLTWFYNASIPADRGLSTR